MTMESPACPVHVRQHSGFIVVQFQEKHITGENWVRKIRRTIGDVIDRMKPPRLAIDLSQVEHVSSAILGELVGANRKVHRRAGKLCLVGMRPEVAEIFAITRLDQSFKLCPTLTEAAAALA